MSRDIQMSLSLSSPPDTQRHRSFLAVVSSLLSEVSTRICLASCHTCWQWVSRAKWLGQHCVSHQEESRSRALAPDARGQESCRTMEFLKCHHPEPKSETKTQGHHFIGCFCFCSSSFLFDLIRINQLSLERGGYGNGSITFSISRQPGVEKLARIVTPCLVQTYFSTNQSKESNHWILAKS